MIQLANTIKSVALANYVPFQGFDGDAIFATVKRHLDVTKHEVLVALEYICQTGE